MSSSQRRRRVPKYCRHKARGLARVTIDGKDHYLGPYGSSESKERYRQIVGEWLDQQQADSLHEQTDVRVCELAVAYLRHCMEYYRKDGVVTREYGCITDALKHVRQHYDLERIDRFGPKALKTVRESMIEAGWSRKYVNKQIGRVVRMFKWGVAEQLVRPTIWQALQAVGGLKRGRTDAPEYAPVKPVSDEVVEKTLPHLSSIVADMVQLQRLVGCRPSEICSLRPVDIDRSADVWRYQVVGHKTEHYGKSRVIWFGPKAQAILSKYLLRDPEAFCFNPSELPNPRRTAGDRYTKDSYGRAVRRAAKKAEVETWSPNRLRHSAATVIRKEFGLEAAQTVLGHASADVTQVYAERDQQLAARVARELG
ncbi:Tyrosine recombinase XerC [Posidoniimonas corsicana]|uniref:Tyrosine recombinase XerC n=1 Tax=Posidoniimonas corsicana TaxID=1938618 RepID=A0A5C5VB26_9BACT|nr:site-specific integrase [Posidoniimonas corsicana]TWT35210.1 Tyrosine recombinase XerC [Posidoniimonas corsicana]